MQDINIQLNADVQQLLQQIQQARNAFGTLRTTTEQVRESVAATFDDAIDGSQTLLGRAADVNKVYQRMQKELADLIKYQQVLKKLAAESTDPARVAQYTRELAEAQRVAARLTQSLQGVSQAAAQAERGSRGIGTSIAQFAVAGGAIAIISQLGKEIIKAAADTEQFRVTFQALTGSVYEGNKLFEELVTLGAKTPFELPQLQTAAKSLLAYGFSASEVTENLTTLGNISAGVGQDKLPQIVLAFGQVKAATKLTGNELRQFTEAGIPLLQQLATDGGKSVKAIQKDVSDGAVGFEQVRTALERLSGEGGKFFGLMEKQSKTLAGQWSNLKDVLGQLASDFGTVLLPALKFVVEGFVGLSSSVKSLFGLNKTMTQQIEEQGGKFRNLIGVLQDTNSSYGAKQKAIATLKAECPELIKNIDLQKASEAQLNGVLTAGNATLKERIALNNKKTALQGTQDFLGALYAEEKKITEELALIETNPAKQSQKYQDIQIKAIKDRLAAARAVIREEEQKEKNQLKDISGSKAPGNSKPSDAAELSDKQKKARVQAADEIVALKEKIAAENRKIDEQDRVENLRDLDKALEAEKIRLENHVKEVQELITKGKGNKDVTEQGNALIVRLTEESADAATQIRAEYAVKEAQAIQEKYAIIEKYTNEGIDKEIKAAERALDADRKKLDELGATQAEIAVLYTKHFENVKAIEQKYELEKLKEFQDTDKGEVSLLKKQLKATLDTQETLFNETKHSEDEITAFKAKQANQREINAEIVAKRLLEIELFYAQQRAAITGKPDQDNIDNLTAQIAAIDDSIGAKSTGKGTTPTSKKSKGKAKNAWELLGFPEDQSALLQEATDETVKAINTIVDAQVAAAEKAVEAANKRVEGTQSALDQEIELAKLGFASNVDARRKDLDDAKAAQTEALQAKQKAARLQLAVDTTQQVSSIAVSAANMFSAYSTIPFVGPIIAAVAIASMLGLIASTRAKAQAISQNQFEAGGQGRVTSKGVIVGNRHSDGGVPLEVEGGEFFASDGSKFGVVNRRMTDKHFGLLAAINSDDRVGMGRYLSNMVELDRSVPDRLFKERDSSVTVNQNFEMKELRENNKLLRRMIDNQERGESVTDLGDRIMIRKGNSTRVVRK